MGTIVLRIFNYAIYSYLVKGHVKNLLKELTKEVGRMGEALPQEKAEQVARDLQLSLIHI